MDWIIWIALGVLALGMFFERRRASYFAEFEERRHKALSGYFDRKGL